MSDTPTREWRFYVDDMIGFAEKVIAYTDDLDQERFVASGLNYDATLRNLELIGEAATNIPDEVAQAKSTNSVAHGGCYTQQVDSWLSGYR